MHKSTKNKDYLGEINTQNSVLNNKNKPYNILWHKHL